MFSRFFTFSEQKHRKYRCFWLRANAKPRYLRGFEPLLAKITVFTVFCGPGIYAVSSMLSEAFSRCQRHKNIINYRNFTHGQYQKIMKHLPKTDKNRPTRTSKTHLRILPSFFPPRTPKKRENLSTPKDFRKGRVAKAMRLATPPNGEASPEWANALVPPTPPLRECGQWREDRANWPSNGLWEPVFCQGRRGEGERW